MLIAFVLQAIFLLSVVTIGRTSDTWFIVTLMLVYFTWGEVYSLFPSTSADFFGTRNASSQHPASFIPQRALGFDRWRRPCSDAF